MPPAEWAKQSAIWIGWPSAADLWLDDLAPAQAEVAALVVALAQGPGAARVRLLANGSDAIAAARKAVGDHADIIPAQFGDIWLRDTGPIFADDGTGALVGRLFGFNGWGDKYDLPGDAGLDGFIAGLSGARAQRHDFILEGGAIDWDGEGTVLTTTECLTNPNRNPGWTRREAEAALKNSLGASKVIWIEEGLLNDHTDGHVDNIARFLAPGVVACQTPFGQDDPHAARLLAIQKALTGQTDAKGRPIRLVTLPSPGRVVDEEGEPIPASHMNFLISNAVVVVPDYGAPSIKDALATLAPHFPGRRIVASPSMAILTGGGSFHCISQQQPDLGEPS
jgi:agmatine deiminase